MFFYWNPTMVRFALIYFYDEYGIKKLFWWSIGQSAGISAGNPNEILKIWKIWEKIQKIAIFGAKNV